MDVIEIDTPSYRTHIIGKSKPMWLNNGCIKASWRKLFLGKDVKTDIVEQL